jgi:hypothetical protein
VNNNGGGNSNSIALGVGIGVGLPAVLIALVAWWFPRHPGRKADGVEEGSGTGSNKEKGNVTVRQAETAAGALSTGNTSSIPGGRGPVQYQSEPGNGGTAAS